MPSIKCETERKVLGNVEIHTHLVHYYMLDNFFSNFLGIENEN